MEMITDFLNTQRSKDDLKITLEVLREFKECESSEEWAMVMFVAWQKLEQLEEFLANLVEGTPLADDTIKYITKHHKEDSHV
jgi:hypothetical protein